MLDFERPECKCLRCIKNRHTPCSVQERTPEDYETDLTQFPPIRSRNEVKEEEVEVDDDERESVSILSERRSSRTPKPTAKKRKRDQGHQEDQAKSTAPMTRAKTKSNASASTIKIKPVRPSTPELPVSDAVIPPLESDKTLSSDQEFRLGTYYAYARDVQSQVDAELNQLRHEIQRIARQEYARGRRDERVFQQAAQARAKRRTSNKCQQESEDQDAEKSAGKKSKNPLMSTAKTFPKTSTRRTKNRPSRRRRSRAENRCHSILSSRSAVPRCRRRRCYISVCEIICVKCR